jgi:hypothetical protein
VTADGVDVNLPGFNDVVFNHFMVNPGCNRRIIHHAFNRIFAGRIRAGAAGNGKYGQYEQ